MQITCIPAALAKLSGDLGLAILGIMSVYGARREDRRQGRERLQSEESGR